MPRPLPSPTPTTPATAWILATAVALLAACGGAPEPEPPAPPAAPPPPPAERARDAAAALGSELMDRLTTALSEGGPVAAIDVCSRVAQEIAAAHSVDGLTVRRVSLKVRNPADEPDAWEREKLLELEALHADGRLPQELVETVGEGAEARLRYLRPIVVMQPCLNCHGDPQQLDAGVREAITQHYPDDQAIGYRQGDLRGAISVMVEL